MVTQKRSIPGRRCCKSKGPGLGGGEGGGASELRSGHVCVAGLRAPGTRKGDDAAEAERGPMTQGLEA